MWGSDDTVSNGACSDPAPSPVNGTALCDHNNMPPDAAVVSYCLSSSSDNHAAHHVPSKFAHEKTSLSKCAVSEASDISISHGTGTASTSANSDARPPAAASVNCHSSTARTSRHLYSNHETDDDGYFASNIDRNTRSTPNGATGHVCQSVCSDRFSSSDAFLPSGFLQMSVNKNVHSDSNSSHTYACCSVNDGQWTENEQVLGGAEAGSSTVVTALSDTSAVIPANNDLCDDGYMDEIDVAGLSTMDVYRYGDSAPWFVETDTCLDDFIDADMPHNAAVAGSTSTSSLSSTHDELNRMPENGGGNTVDGLTDDVIHLSDSDVSVNSQRHLHENVWQSSSSEERGTGVSSCCRLGHSDLNGSRDQHVRCTRASQTSDTAMAHTWHEINMQTGTANLASESSNCTPPVSVPSLSDNYYNTAGDAELAAGEFLTTVANEEVFEGSIAAGAGTAMKKPSDTSEMYDRSTDPKQSQCYWLPVGTESDVPKFVCWSCFEVMNSAGRLRSADSRDTGIMSRSATADYSSHDPSDLLTDDDENLFASVLSMRMFSSLTL